MRGLLFITIFLLLFLISCDYRIQKKAELPFQEIYLRNVENLTLEPGLQDRFRNIAYRALVENGFNVTSSAERIMDVQLTNYRLSTLSEIGLNTVEYQVSMNVKVLISDSSGKKIREFSPSSPFTTYFRTSRELQRLIADRNLAIESLMRDICDDMVRRIIFSEK